MKFFYNTILTALMALGLGYFLPWYALPIVCFLMSLLLKLKPWQAFLSTLIGASIYAAVYTITLDNLNDSLLSRKISGLVFNQDNRWFSIIGSCVVVAITAALASLAGSLWRKQTK